MQAVAEGLRGLRSRWGDARAAQCKRATGNKEVTDVNLYGQTANMADIDTRTVELGRYFTPSEVEHHAAVCMIGDTLVQQLFTGSGSGGRHAIRLGNDEFLVIGVMEKIGSVLGQDQDNFRDGAAVGVSADEGDAQRA